MDNESRSTLFSFQCFCTQNDSVPQEKRVSKNEIQNHFKEIVDIFSKMGIFISAIYHIYVNQEKLGNIRKYAQTNYLGYVVFDVQNLIIKEKHSTIPTIDLANKYEIELPQPQHLDLYHISKQKAATDYYFNVVKRKQALNSLINDFYDDFVPKFFESLESESLDKIDELLNNKRKDYIDSLKSLTANKKASKEEKEK